MVSHNHVILTGKVAKPPLRHYRPDGSPVVQFSLELNHQEDAFRGREEEPDRYRGHWETG